MGNKQWIFANLQQLIEGGFFNGAIGQTRLNYLRNIELGDDERFITNAFAILKYVPNIVEARALAVDPNDDSRLRYYLNNQDDILTINGDNYIVTNEWQPAYKIRFAEWFPGNYIEQ